MQFSGFTHKGKVRANNQDSFRIYEENGIVIAVICDGMGGANAGNVASEIAADSFMEKAKKRIFESGYDNAQLSSVMDKILIQAVDEANLSVYKKSIADSSLSGMGTTLVGAVFLEDKVYSVNVGDSRIYRYHNKDLEQISHDHSLVQALVDAGNITKEQAKTHPNRNVILRALGIEERVESEIYETDMEDSVFLLCSDGLSNYFNSKLPKKMLDSKKSLEEKANDMIEYAIDKGGADNITVILIDTKGEKK